MIFKNTIDKLRNRPKGERSLVAWWISAGVVGILLIGWVLHFFGTIGTSGVQVQAPSGLGQNVLNLQAINEAQKQFLGGASEQ